MTVDILYAGARALSFLTLLQAGGIVLFLALHEPELPNSATVLRRLGIVASLAAAVVAIAEYLLEAPRMSGDLAGAFDPTLHGLLAHSVVGVSFSWRMLGLVLVTVALRARHAAGTAGGVFGVVVLLAAFTFVGHTASSSERWLLSPLLLVHLAVVTFWFGALLPLYLVTSRERAETVARIVAQFSARAIWLVPILFLAGVTLAAGLLPGVTALRSRYGELLLLKVAGFGALLLLAASNRWRWGPALRSGAEAARAHFRYALSAEYLLMVGVLSVTAVMTSLYSPER